MYSKKFPTSEDAETYLKEKGTLKFHGRAGRNYEYCVYTYDLFDGRRYYVDIYDDGKIVVKDI